MIDWTKESSSKTKVLTLLEKVFFFEKCVRTKSLKIDSKSTCDNILDQMGGEADEKKNKDKRNTVKKL